MSDKWNEFIFSPISEDIQNALRSIELNDPRLEKNLLRFMQNQPDIFNTLSSLAYESSEHNGATYRQMLEFGTKIFLLVKLEELKTNQVLNENLIEPEG